MADEKVMSKVELLGKMQVGWRDLSAYLKTLTDEQMTTLHDAVGWSIKDHLVHLAVWEDGIAALLSKQSRLVAMHVDQATWESNDFDKSNAVIQQQFKDMPLSGVLSALQDAHERMMGQVQMLSDDDLKRPYRDWQPDSTSDNPILGSILGNSCDHYAEHIPWMDAIARGS